MLKQLLLILTVMAGSFSLVAQETFPRNDVKDERAEAYAFTNATIFTDYKTKLESATLLIKDGKIEAAGTNVSVPKGYIEVDLNGKHIYPSLIDMHTSYGLPEIKRNRGGGFSQAEQIQSKTKGAYNANEAIKAEYNAFQEFSVDSKSAKEWRGIGFGSVLTFRADGAARGASAVVTLGEDRDNTVMLKSQAAAHYAFSRGTSRQMYPASLMGYISLLRQTYLDAKWYGAQKEKPFTDKSLDAWINLQQLPQIFSTNNWQSVLRADKVGDEFGVQYIIKSGGDSYRRIDEVKKANAALIVPLTFPAAYDVDDPLDAYQVSLADMKHWELAPTNLAHLAKNGITFAITTDGLKSKKQFWTNLRKAIKHGLSEEAALAALTHTPAQLLGMSDQIGSLKEGMAANFLITSGSLFDEKAVIYENWVQGKPYIIKEKEESDLSGAYKLVVDGTPHQLEISGDPGKHKAKIVVNDTTDISVKMSIEEALVTLDFNPDSKDKKGGTIALSGWVNEKNMQGQGQMPDGKWISWLATHEGEVKVEGKSRKMSQKGDGKQEADEPELGAVIYPFLAYGNAELPKQEDILIKNASVWTMENDKVLENTDVLLQNGKIAQIGKNLSAGKARVIDGTDKHVTPGIVDEHSHVAGGGNERLSNSSLVRIGDQVNSEDLGIYRALAGGVTTIQVLHGSANPIGGQSALIKLRWGQAAESLKIGGADKYIKFALGENVKRSRSPSSIRYPQSRMGVEQVFVDAFTAALDYEKEWKAYEGLSASEKAKAPAPRRDLAMEAMVDILRRRMFITCHSYVQSEINMLMKVAERFGFNINTFTHILEGYKVADKMAKHGVGGSSFADWWAYKWEVRYAIPYNPAIMMREGVVTAVNSDDAEMMRRLNQEAAKSIKYGSVSEMDALKMVTINPAKLLHLDDQLGSLKVGKDADVVVWSDNPLSIYAKAEQTIVDGTVYFDLEKDQETKASIQKERARLIAKMKLEKSNGGATQRARGRMTHDFHCDDIIIYDEQ